VVYNRQEVTVLDFGWITSRTAFFTILVKSNLDVKAWFCLVNVATRQMTRIEIDLGTWVTSYPEARCVVFCGRKPDKEERQNIYTIHENGRMDAVQLPIDYTCEKLVRSSNGASAGLLNTREQGTLEWFELNLTTKTLTPVDKEPDEFKPEVELTIVCEKTIVNGHNLGLLWLAKMPEEKEKQQNRLCLGSGAKGAISPNGKWIWKLTDLGVSVQEILAFPKKEYDEAVEKHGLLQRAYYVTDAIPWISWDDPNQTIANVKEEIMTNLSYIGNDAYGFEFTFAGPGDPANTRYGSIKGIYGEAVVWQDHHISWISYLK